MDKKLLHLTDMVLGAKLDETGATYVAIEDGAFGYVRVPVPEDVEAGGEVTLILKGRVVG